MKQIEEALNPIIDNLFSIERDTLKGHYELNIGIPMSWIFDSNSDIECEIISENDLGKVLKIFPKNDTITIDDLVLFVEVIINTNKKIAEKEKEFKDKMAQVKKELEKQTSEFYSELDDIKEKSFKNISEDFSNELKNNKAKTNKKKSSSDTKEDTPIIESPIEN